MGATEEQMRFLAGMQITHVSYILLLFSVAFLLFLFVNVLLHIYAQNAWPIEKAIRLPKHRDGGPNGTANGHALNGRPRAETSDSIDEPAADLSLTRPQRDQLRDASEFELEALMSEEESGGSASGRRKETTIV